jgi:hypothetical protein
MGDKKVKILVLGGSGIPDHTIAIYLKESGRDVAFFSIRDELKYLGRA